MRIAIVGIGCAFPGAVGPDAFWELLAAGRDAIGPTPPERWDAAALWSDDADAPGRVLTREGGFIADPAGFDPAFFSISEREAQGMDPRQRLALKLAWWTLEDAGIPPPGLGGSATGIFIGASNSEFGDVDDLAALGAHSGTGLSNAVIANRISYFLDLSGPSLVIDTACSSSLVAVHLACGSLASGECDLALAGGVSLMLRADPSVAFSRARMLAPDGRCKSFADGADGYGRGEGGGFVAIKRLADALRDGDRIRAVIRGSAVNQDGQSNGLTAPSGPAQERVIRRALAVAGIDPARVQYVEAHGTGTPLGDQIEARALGNALGRVDGRDAPLRLGSAKSNIGHLEAAAGIAGLVKLALAIERRQLPPSLHCAAPNPRIDFAGLNLDLVAEPAAWPDPEAPIAGVSSFGFGGTNCHVVLEGAAAPAPAKRADDAAHLLVLSAASAESLRRLARDSASRVGAMDGSAVAGVADSARDRRAALPHRAAIVGLTSADIANDLCAFAEGKPSGVVAGVAPRRAPRLAFIYSGQGAQRAGMARSLLDTAPVFRAAIDEASEILGFDLARLLRDESADLSRTDLTQPTLLAVEIGLTRLWASWGVEPEAVIGHSLGEYAAATAAGAIAYPDALRLIAERGRLMQALTDRGGMVSVFAAADAVSPHLASGAVIAAYNGPEQLAIAGTASGLAATCENLRRAGIEPRPLAVSAGFHSPAIEPMLDEFTVIAANMPWRELRLPLVANETAALLKPGHTIDAAHWRRHARSPVRFADSAAALAEAGYMLAIEIGPGRMLGRLAALSVSADRLRVLPSLADGRDDLGSLRKTLGALFVAGRKIAQTDTACITSHLPLYPFDEKPYPLRIDTPRRPSTALPAAIDPAPAIAVAPIPPTGASVEDRLRALVADLLGVSPDRVDPTAPFLEMGADSLVLIGAVRRIETEFGITLAVRAFFEELSTIAALAAHIGAATPTPTVEIKPAAPAIVRPRSAAPPAATLTERQRAHLDALTRAYTARTAASKAYAAKHRQVLADSRGTAGFRFSIKEMLYPIVGRDAGGSHFRDLDGNDYVDLAMGFGVHLFGHEPQFLRDALAASLEHGLRLGPQSDLAGEVAERLAVLSGQDRVAFLNSGTEAVMTALRLARTVTGRERVALFRGSYHGHSDGVLGDAAGNPPWGVPIVPGVTRGAVADLLVLDYGSDAALDLLRRHGSQLAAVLVEPVQSRHPELQPGPFLRELRRIADAAGCLVIFDEMITGFRIHPGGAQAHFGVKADLVTYGKILGGGLPIGVVAGQARVMAAIDGGAWEYGDASFPGAETTFFAGTFNKHPLTMAAALSVLREIERQGPALQQRLNDRAGGLAGRLDGIFDATGAPIRIERFGSLFRFGIQQNLDPFFYHLALRGLYVWEGRTCFLSTAHDDSDLDQIVAVVADSIEAMREGEFLSAAPRRTAAASFPLSLAQRQLALLAAFDTAGSAAYNLALALELDGPVDASRLATALTEVAGRHDGPMTACDGEADTQRTDPAPRLPLAIEDVAETEIEPRLSALAAEPFDIARPPLLRAHLLVISPARAILLLVGHHIVFDGLALQVFVDEVAVRYSGKTLPPVTARMRDHVAWQRAQLDTPEWRAHRDWWRETLVDPPAGPDLLLARHRPPSRRYAGARAVRDLDPALLEAVRSAAGAKGATLPMALTAAVAATMVQLGAGDDIVIGVPYAGRGLPGGERVVGYCAHLLPVRLRLAADAALADVLAETRTRLLDAYAHADYPLAAILDSLALRRDPTRPPLIAVTVNHDRVDTPPEFAGLTVQPRPVPARHAKFDFGVNLLTWDGGARLEIDYDTDLFDEAGAAYLLKACERLLATLRDAPQTRLDAFALPAISGWRESPAPGFVPLPGRIERFASKDPAAPTIEMPGHKTISRGDLLRWSADIAERAAGRLSTPGPVALVLPRGPAIPAAMLAAWRLGRPFLPLEYETPPTRLRELLTIAGAACAIGVAGGPANLPCPIVEIDETLPAPGAAPPAAMPEPAPGQPAYILFTSGSTGTPKPVVVPHRAVAAYLDALIARLGLEPGLGYGLASTFAADLGMTAILPALAHGGRLVIVPAATARDPDAFAELMRGARVDLLKIVPGHLEGLLSAARPEDLLPRRVLVLGGEAARPHLLETLAGLKPACRVVNHYGPTEATVGVMTGEWDGRSAAIVFDAPLAGVRILLLDETGHRVADGEYGEVHLGGPGLALGYLGQPTQTAERFIDHPLAGRLYRTGDLGRVAADGGLELRGRIDDQVKIRGYRVEPAEMAAALEAHPAIAAAVGVAATHPLRGACLVAYAVARAGQSLDSAGLQRFLTERLPDHMLPAAIVPLAALPFGANGKLDRAALPEPQFDRAVVVEPESAPDSPGENTLEAELAAVWRQVFNQAAFGRHDSFFDLGGDSILGMQVVARLHRVGLHLDAGDLYRHPTIAELATRLRPVGGGTAEQGILTGPVPLLPSQHRFFALYGEAAPHFNLSVLLDLEPWVTPDMVERAVTLLAEHHDGLRLAFAGNEARFAAEISIAFSLIADGVDPAASFAALQGGLDPSSGRMIGAAFAEGAPARLLLAVHHLATDGVSLQLLLEDLRALLLQLRDGRPPSLGVKTASLRQVAEAFAARAGTPALAEETDYWELVGSLPPTELPLLPTAPADDINAAETRVTVGLDPADTAALLRWPAAAGILVEDVLVAALTLALGEWSGEPALYIELEGHGRDADDGLDIARTLGWLSSRYPAWFDLSDTPAANAASAIHDQRGDIPGRGIGFGLLRYLGPHTARRRLAGVAQPQISFNYLGQIAPPPPGAFSVVSWAPERPERGPERGGDLCRAHALAVEAMIIDGRLVADWQFNPRRHDPEAMAKAAAAFARHIPTLVAACAARTRADPHLSAAK
jgi:amino acid adenylation domain-containing protein/non-ribosomal peptide synthase protein (TIGR01720 family)